MKEFGIYFIVAVSIAIFVTLIASLVIMKNNELPVDKLPYSIVDANGLEHRFDCYGYTIINADSIEMCNGVKIKYSKNKPIDVIPK